MRYLALGTLAALFLIWCACRAIEWVLAQKIADKIGEALSRGRGV